MRSPFAAWFLASVTAVTGADLAFARAPGDTAETPPGSAAPGAPSAAPTDLGSNGSTAATAAPAAPTPEKAETTTPAEATRPVATESPAKAAQADGPDKTRDSQSIETAEAVLAAEAPAASEYVHPQTLSIYGFTDFGFNKVYTSDKS